MEPPSATEVDVAVTEPLLPSLEAEAGVATSSNPAATSVTAGATSSSKSFAVLLLAVHAVALVGFGILARSDFDEQSEYSPFNTLAIAQRIQVCCCTLHSRLSHVTCVC